MKKCVVYLLLAWGLCSVGFGALAACNPEDIGHTNFSDFPSTISIPTGKAIGEPIGGKYGPYSGFANGTPLGCTYVPYLFLAFNTPMSPTSIPNVYETNIPGVGVKVWSEYGSKVTYIGTNPTYWYQSNQSWATAWLADIYMQLYVIGPLSSGTMVLPNPLIKAMTSSSSYSLSADSKVYNTMGFNEAQIVVPTCSVDTASRDQVVSLPKTSIHKFSGVGSFTGNKPFSMKLSCAAGVSVYATINDANDVTNTGQNLTLDSTSTAAGVGVQILANGSNTPFSFGSDNQFYLFQNTSTNTAFLSVPFQSRYVQTKSIISAGTVIAKATISFNYM